jgi:hypothetical protein
MRTPDAPREDPFKTHLRGLHGWTEEKLDAVEGRFEPAHQEAHNKAEPVDHPEGELSVGRGVRYQPPPPEIRKLFGSFAEHRDQAEREDPR